MKDLDLFQKVEENLWVSSLFGEDAKMLNDFYSEAPFPNYNIHDDVQSLVSAPDRNPFLTELSEMIEANQSFLEVGCGTGQLSNYLAATSQGRFLAVDGSINSIKLGSEFAQKHRLERVNFIQMDLFDLQKFETKFDYVWCSGVLHHTNAPKEGFDTLAKMVKKDGLIFIGLYNHISRLRTVLRQKVFSCLGKGILAENFVKVFDPYARSCANEPKKLNAWLNDQYRHPIESLHSMNEVHNWFEECGFELVGSVPSLQTISPQTVVSAEPINFDQMTSMLFETGALFGSNGSEGGLFLMVGRRV